MQERYGNMDRKYIQQLEQEYASFQSASKYNLESEEVFCVCRKPDRGELMVACDGCDEWFHFKCMHMDLKHRDLVNNFYCKFCDTLFNKGKSVWKRKCKLSRCYKPIEAKSQFCSHQHGVEHWTGYLERFQPSGATLGEIGKGDIINIIQNVDSRLKLNELGLSLPKYDKENLKITAAQKKVLTENEKIIEAHRGAIRLLQVKAQYIQKLKTLVSQVNEYLTTALDPDNQADEENENDAIDQKKKKGKRGQKTKKFKIDICGYNSKIFLENDKWVEYTQTAAFEQLKNFTNLTPSEITMVAKLYEDYTKESEDVMTIKTENSSILLDICLKEKRKCQLHNGWFNIISNDLDLKISENNIEIEENIKLTEDVNKFIEIHNWEVYCSNSLNYNLN